MTFKASAVLFMVLIVAGVTALALGMAQLLPGDLRQSLSAESALRAEEAARSGLEIGLQHLRTAGKTEWQASREPDNVNGVNCVSGRIAEKCRGVDRLTGLADDVTPNLVDDLADDKLTVELAEWFQPLTGNYPGAMLGDYLDAATNAFPWAANRNPRLERDDTRVLAVPLSASLVLYWQPEPSSCRMSDVAIKTQAVLLVSQFDQDGVVLSRDISHATTEDVQTYSFTTDSRAVYLTVSFLATRPDEPTLSGCFARYALAPTAGRLPLNTGAMIIRSKGKYLDTTRQWQLIVEREIPTVLPIFSYGLVCQTCAGL